MGVGRARPEATPLALPVTLTASFLRFLVRSALAAPSSSDESETGRFAEAFTKFCFCFSRGGPRSSPPRKLLFLTEATGACGGKEATELLATMERRCKLSRSNRSQRASSCCIIAYISWLSAIIPSTTRCCLSTVAVSNLKIVVIHETRTLFLACQICLLQALNAVSLVLKVTVGECTHLRHQVCRR